MTDAGGNVISYAIEPPRRNRAAVLALVFGMLLFVPFLPGVLAIRFGRRGRRDARDYALGGVRTAHAGVILGVINLCLWTILLSVYVFHARREALMAQRRAELRSIGIAILLYTNHNRGRPPHSWQSLLADGEAHPNDSGLADLVRKGAHARYCLAGEWNPPPNSWRMVGVTPEYLVWAWEPPMGRGSSARMNVLMADGHVETFSGPLTAKIDADLRAGGNPPPALDANAARNIQYLATTRALAASRAAASRPATEATSPRHTIAR